MSVSSFLGGSGVGAFAADMCPSWAISCAAPIVSGVEVPNWGGQVRGVDVTKFGGVPIGQTARVSSRNLDNRTDMQVLHADGPVTKEGCKPAAIRLG